MDKYYIYFVWEDVDPEIIGPFETEEVRDGRAKELRKEHGEDHGIYWLNIDSAGPKTGAYTGGLLDGEGK